jgi:phage terminase Nu1 subunit (DNA packaging protein)
MPNVVLVDANSLCSAKQLSEVIGISVRQVHHLVAEGVLKQTRVNSRRYCLAESVQSYLKYQRAYVAKECSKDTSAYDRARTRRMTALAETEELHLKRVRGELLQRNRIVFVMTTLLGQVKNHLLGVPIRVSRLVVGQKDLHKVKSLLTDAIHVALRELSDFDPQRFEQRAKLLRKNGEHVVDD